MKKIVIMQFDDLAHPGNAHWFCFGLPNDLPEKGFEMMGHKVVELPDEEAHDILEMATISLNLQLRLRALCYPPEPRPAPLPASSDVDQS
jgi:hypothetical protein